MNTLSTQGRKENLIFIIIFVYIAMFFAGVGSVMYTVMLPHIVSAYSLKLTQSGLIIPFLALGEFTAILLGGLIVERVKKVNLILLSFIGFVAMFFLIGGKPPRLYGILSAYFAIGMCGNILNIAASSYIADAYPMNRSAYLNILHSMYALGSLLGPLYCTSILNSGFEWNEAYLKFALICLPIIIFYAPVTLRHKDCRTADKPQVQHKTKIFNFTLLRDRRILLLSVMSMVYIGYCYSYNTWFPSYMSGFLRFDKTFISFIITGYWAGVVAGRLIYPLLARHVAAKRYLFFGNMAGGIILLCGVWIGLPVLLMVSIFVTGLVTSINNPLILAIACDLYPLNAGSATTITYMAGGLGGIIAPLLMGKAAGYFPFTSIIMFIPVILVLVALLALLLSGLSKTGTDTARGD